MINDPKLDRWLFLQTPRFIMFHLVYSSPSRGISIYVICPVVILVSFLSLCSRFSGLPQSNVVFINFEDSSNFLFPVEAQAQSCPQCDSIHSGGRGHNLVYRKCGGWIWQLFQGSIFIKGVWFVYIIFLSVRPGSELIQYVSSSCNVPPFCYL